MTGSQPSPAPLGRRFLTVWAGQTLSGIGSAMSAIGVAVYVFLETGNALWLGVLTALTAVPSVLVAPFGGWIDRYPRRTVMLAADAFAAVGPAVALALAFAGGLEVWHLVVAGFLAALGNAVQLPAAQAAVPLLVEPDAIGRANGLNQLAPALGFVVGPVVATPLVANFGVRSVLLIDAATFLIAVATTALVAFDDPTDAGGTEAVEDDRSWAAGWAWLRRSGRPLLALMVAMAVVNFALAFFNVAIQVVAIDVGGAARAGLVFGVAGAAMIGGSLWIGRRGVPARRMRAVTVGLMVVAAGGAISGLRPSLLLVTLGVFVALCAVPALNASVSTIFHEHVPATMQGRVFGLRYAIARGLDPVGSVLAGLVVAELAEPAMADGGTAAGSIGRLIGSGEGRGAAAVLVAMAIGLAVLAAGVRRSTAYAALDRSPVLEPGSSDGEYVDPAAASVTAV
jgi:MFS family permease